MSVEKPNGVTRRQTEILNVLWEKGEATSGEIAEGLADRPADSTVRSLLQIMDERGLVTDDGAAYRRKYRAAVSRSEVEDAELNRLLNTKYAGSVDALLNELIESDLLDNETLERARTRLGKTPEPRAPKVKAIAERVKPTPMGVLMAGGVAFGLGLLLGRR